MRLWGMNFGVPNRYKNHTSILYSNNFNKYGTYFFTLIIVVYLYSTYPMMLMNNYLSTSYMFEYGVTYTRMFLIVASFIAIIYNSL